MNKKIKTTNGFEIIPFGNGGYQVSQNDEIIEINFRDKLSGSSLFYGGPLQVMGNLKDDNNIQEIIDNPHWIGIEKERMTRYQSWINRDATCGMISAAVLLAYYQDYIDESIIDESIRRKGSSSYENLYPELLKEITSFSPKGTIAYDVSMGINRFLRKQKRNHRYKAKGSLVPTFGIVSSKLKQKEPKPVIVGLNTLLGSPKNYLNHWVLAYQVLQINNQKYYLVHDNHGRAHALINARWTIGVVRLLEK